MNWNLTFADQDLDDPVERARAIRSCLDYLAEELDSLEMSDAALLIEAATEAVEEWLDQRDPLRTLLAKDPETEAD